MSSGGGRTFHFNFAINEDFLREIRSEEQEETELLLMSKCLSVTFGSLVCRSSLAASPKQPVTVSPNIAPSTQVVQSSNHSPLNLATPENLQSRPSSLHSPPTSVAESLKPTRPDFVAQIQAPVQNATKPLKRKHNLEEKLSNLLYKQEANSDASSPVSNGSDVWAKYPHVEVSDEACENGGARDMRTSSVSSMGSTSPASSTYDEEEFLNFPPGSRFSHYPSDSKPWRLSESERRNLQCAVCGKKFKQMANISRHKRMMHSSIPDPNANIHSPDSFVLDCRTQTAMKEINCNPTHQPQYKKDLESQYGDEGSENTPTSRKVVVLTEDTVQLIKNWERELQMGKNPNIADDLSAEREALKMSDTSGMSAHERDILRSSPHFEWNSKIKPKKEAGASAGPLPFPIETTPFERKTLACSFCKYQFTILSNLRRHKRAYGHYDKLPCNKCNEIFTSEERRINHQLVCGKNLEGLSRKELEESLGKKRPTPKSMVPLDCSFDPRENYSPSLESSDNTSPLALTKESQDHMISV